MIEVEQRIIFTPGGPRGDCLRACVASIFELPYEEVPNFDGRDDLLALWVKRVLPGVRYQSRHLGDTWNTAETLESYKEWPTQHYEPGYWIAGVHSPRVPDTERYGCGCGGEPECRWCEGKPESRFLGIDWGLHAVVMYGGKLVWDPHPERDMGIGPFRGAHTFVVEDPSELLKAVRS